MYLFFKIILLGVFLLGLPCHTFSQRRPKSDCQDTLYALTYMMIKPNGKKKTVRIIVYADTNKKSCRNKKISLREYEQYLGLQFYDRDSSGQYRERYFYFYHNGERDSCLGFKDSIGVYRPLNNDFMPDSKRFKGSSGVYRPFLSLSDFETEWEAYPNYFRCLSCEADSGIYWGWNIFNAKERQEQKTLLKPYGKGWPTFLVTNRVTRIPYNDGSLRFRYNEHIKRHRWQETFFRQRWYLTFVYSPALWIDLIEVTKDYKLQYELLLIDKKEYGL